jgi:hypothetical protein
MEGGCVRLPREVGAIGIRSGHGDELVVEQRLDREAAICELEPGADFACCDGGLRDAGDRDCGDGHDPDDAPGHHRPFAEKCW